MNKQTVSQSTWLQNVVRWPWTPSSDQKSHVPLENVSLERRRDSMYIMEDRCTFKYLIHSRCWQRTYPDLPLVIIERFQRTWRKYLDSVIVQAENRSRKHILHPEDYLRERVDNIGIWPSVAIGEQCLRLEIPHECMEHPYLEDMRTWCSELVTLQNVSTSDTILVT